jgi:hypothetical protein
MSETERKEMTVTELMESQPVQAMKLGRDEIKVIWETICPSATVPELWLFLNFCRMRGLNPLIPGQVAFEAWTQNNGKRNRMIMPMIHGMRYMVSRDFADRYRPGREEVSYDGDGAVVGALVSCWRKIADEWHEIVQELRWTDLKTLWDGGNKPAWRNWPRDKMVIATEARLLRRAFPESVGGLYVPDEMEPQIDVDELHRLAKSIAPDAPDPKSTPEDARKAGTDLFNKVVRFYHEQKDWNDPKSYEAAKTEAIRFLQAAVKKDSIREWLAEDLVKAQRAFAELSKPRREEPRRLEAATPPSASAFGDEPPPEEDPAPAAEQPQVEEPPLTRPPTSGAPAATPKAEDAQPATRDQRDLLARAFRAWCKEAKIGVPAEQDDVINAYLNERWPGAVLDTLTVSQYTALSRDTSSKDAFLVVAYECQARKAGGKE